MTVPREHIPPSTGSERFALLAARAQLIYRCRDLAVQATMHGNAPLPMPPEDVAAAKDLRRGRMHPLGRVFWFLDILKKRQHPNARELAERLRDLVSEAIELEFPASRQLPVIAKKEMVRVWRPEGPTKALRVVRPRGPGEGTSGRGVA